MRRRDIKKTQQQYTSSKIFSIFSIFLHLTHPVATYLSGMASKLSYQRNVCRSDIDNNRQSARVSINDIPQRLDHNCRQDYTSAEKQIQCFAGCLAGTDIMAGALGQPLFIAELIYRLTGSPASEFCIIPLAARRLSRAFVLISLQHLALISIERYKSIKFLFKYNNIVTKRRLIVSVVLAGSQIFLEILFFFYKLSFLSNLFHAFAIFLAIFTLIFSRIASYQEARNRMREITTQSTRAKFLKKKKTLKTTSFVVGVVLLCYLPMTLFRISLGALITSPDTFLAVESLMLTFALCNSFVNPVIYCVRSTQYRRAFKKRLCRANPVQPI